MSFTDKVSQLTKEETKYAIRKTLASKHKQRSLILRLLFSHLSDLDPYEEPVTDKRSLFEQAYEEFTFNKLPILE